MKTSPAHGSDDDYNNEQEYDSVLSVISFATLLRTENVSLEHI